MLLLLLLQPPPRMTRTQLESMQRTRRHAAKLPRHTSSPTFASSHAVCCAARLRTRSEAAETCDVEACAGQGWRLRPPTCGICTRAFLAAGTVLLLQHEQLTAQLHKLPVCGTQGRCRRFRFVERVHFSATSVTKSKAAGVLRIVYSTSRTINSGETCTRRAAT